MKKTKIIRIIILSFMLLLLPIIVVQASNPDFTASATIGFDAMGLSNGKIILKVNGEPIAIDFPEAAKVARWNRVDFSFDAIDIIVESRFNATSDIVISTLHYPIPTMPNGNIKTLNYGFVPETYDSEMTKLPGEGVFDNPLTCDSFELSIDAYDIANLWIIDSKALSVLPVDAKNSDDLQFGKSSSSTYVDDKFWLGGGGIAIEAENLDDFAAVHQMPFIDNDTLVFTGRSGIQSNFFFMSMKWVVKSGKVTVEYFDGDDKIQLYETTLSAPIEILFSNPED